MTATTTPRAGTPTRSHVRLDDGLRHVGVVTIRNVMRFVRLPQLLLFNTVQPVMFLLLFTFAFGGTVELAPGVAEAGGYINYLIPGVLIQQAAFGSMNTGIGLTEDLRTGVIDRFRSLPMSRSAVLMGRTLADLTRNAAVTTIMLGLGALLGWRVAQGLWAAVLAVVLALAFGHALSWVIATVGLAVKSPEIAQTAGFLPMFPLVFASSAFLPTAAMPGWLRAFADHQPLSIVANAIRSLTLNDASREALGIASSGALVGLALLWIAAIMAVFVPWAVRLYKRMEA